MAITKVKGTYDLLPSESYKWAQLENIFRRCCAIYNYQEIRTPIMEYSELFHRSVGEGSDLVRKETYDFLDRGDRKVTLRPEGTASIVRSYIENKLYADGQMQKLFYIGSMFRYERPQKGRYRQFNQFGVEVFGSNDPISDAEVISLACTVIRAVGLKNIKVRLNSLGDDLSRENYRTALKNYFTPHIDLLCGDCKDRLDKNPLRILDCKIDKDLEIFKKAPKINDYLTEESKQHFESVKEYLKSMKIEYVIDDNLVRGLDYYTHTIFEVEAEIEGFGAQNVLAGGGRYNHLVASLDGPETPAVGFAFGIERLMYAIEAEKSPFRKFNTIHVFLIALGDDAKLEAVRINNELRLGGLTTEIDYQNKNLKGQFKLADRYEARFIAILGDNELANKTINLKDKVTNTEETILLDDLYDVIVDKLSQSQCNGNCHSCQSECEE